MTPFDYSVGEPMSKPKGFKNVSASISKKEGVPIKDARAILAASSRGASAKAKNANPALRKVE